MTLVIALSDTHGHHDRVKVPPGDLLIHAGDCTDDAGQASLRRFLQWMERQPCRHKVLIAGNHDWAFEKWPDLARAMVKEVAPSVTYLQDSGAELCGLKLWGSPVQPTFLDWAFNRDRGAPIRSHWDLIPDDTDILITHGPAYGQCDKVEGGRERAGCRDLYEALLRVRPAIHVSGHLHLQGGQTTTLVHDDGSKTLCANVAVVNEAYQPVNQPRVIDL